MTTKAPTAWFAAQRDDLFIIAERNLKDKVFAMNLDTEEFSIVHGRRKAVFGKLLKVDIREGQRLLLLPAGSEGRGVE